MKTTHPCDILPVTELATLLHVEEGEWALLRQDRALEKLRTCYCFSVTRKLKSPPSLARQVYIWLTVRISKIQALLSL